MSSETKESKENRPIREIMYEVAYKSQDLTPITIHAQTTMASLLSARKDQAFAWGRAPVESKSERKDFGAMELCCKYRPAGSQSVIYHDMARYGVASIPFPFEALSKQLPPGTKYGFLQSASIECMHYDGETARIALANPVSNTLGTEQFYHLYGPEPKQQGVYSTDINESSPARVGLVIERCKSVKSEPLVVPAKFPGLTPAFTRSVDSVLGESTIVAPKGLVHERQPGSKELVVWVPVATECVKASELARIVFAYWPALKMHADAQLHGLLQSSGNEATSGLWVSLYRAPLEQLVFWRWHREGRHRLVNLVDGLPLCLQALSSEEWDGVRSAIVRESGKFLERCMSFDLKIQVIPLTAGEVDASVKDDNGGNPATIVRLSSSQKSSAVTSRRDTGPAGGYSRLSKKVY